MSSYLPFAEVPAPDYALAGYCHPGYVRSLAEFGEPLALPAAGGWLLRRTVPGFVDCDAMGCYPIFSAKNWTNVASDLADLTPRLVSVALVADPFGEYAPEDLRSSFDRVVAFKDHYVTDLSRPLNISKHHVYYAKKAAAAVTIEVGPPPEGFCTDWVELYGSLIRRRNLTGIKAFSRAAFEVQLGIPGMVVVRALRNGVLVGAHLWYEQQGVAYSHLAAATELGYEFSCSYAIYSATLEHFRSRVKYVDFGAGAGTAAQDNGLSRFKSGWSNGLRTAYFCGKILNPERYEALTKALKVDDTDYFPSYRSGELA